MSFELPPELVGLRETVLRDFEQSEKRHAGYRRKWDWLYGLYRSYKRLRNEYDRASPRDKDTGIFDAQRVWGTELFIPYSFTVVETILPRLMSSRPRMLILPRTPASEKNVENMKLVVDAQQSHMDYELKSQETVKSELIYGFGVQFTYWRKETRTMMQLEQATVPSDDVQWVERPVERTLWDDPDIEDVDIFDFFWDPFAASIDRCEYAIRRVWRTTRYVQRMIETGRWANPAGASIEDIQGLGKGGTYDEIVNERLQASGGPQSEVRNEQLHEVLEYHDGEQVISLLDREIPVQVGKNPNWHGELPFQTCKPTSSGMKELPGIGEIEPIEALQQEINVLRSQRRDNAALKLMQVFAFSDGFVDPGDLVFAPGAGIPVQGDPREMLFPVNIGDIPNSGYQEESNLQSDIERVTGISDPVMGTGDASQTATGVQLVQAAANVRIANKTRRAELELMKRSARQVVAMNQQMIRTRDVRRDIEPSPQHPEGRYEWVTLTPHELDGEFIIEPEGGSTAPDNVPQQRADAQQLLMAFRGDPSVDQEILYEEVLRLFGVRAPRTWIVPDQTRVPPVVLDLLVQQGVPKEMLAQVLEAAWMIEEQQKALPPQAQGNPNEPPGQEQQNGSQPSVRAG